MWQHGGASCAALAAASCMTLAAPLESGISKWGLASSMLHLLQSDDGEPREEGSLEPRLQCVGTLTPSPCMVKLVKLYHMAWSHHTPFHVQMIKLRKPCKDTQSTTSSAAGLC